MVKKLIMVTGATGGIGRSAVDYLTHRIGDEGVTGIRAVIRKASPFKDMKQRGVVDGYMTDLHSLADYFLANALRNVHAIWHCAGNCSPLSTKKEYMQDNHDVSLKMYQAAGKMGIPQFVYISTAQLYRGQQSLKNVKESQLAANLSEPYVQSMIETERALQVASKKFPKTRLIILRSSPVYGPHDRFIIPTLQAMTSEEGVIRLPKEGDVLLDFCYSGNLAHAMWLATFAPDTVGSGEVFNITDDRPVKINSMVERFFSTKGETIAIRKLRSKGLLAKLFSIDQWFAESPSVEPRLIEYVQNQMALDMTLDISKAKSILKYQPVYSMQYAITETVDWIQGIRPL